MNIETTLLSLDPGPVTSAFLYYDVRASALGEFGEVPTEDLLTVVATQDRAHEVVVESMTGYNQIASADEFLTAIWVGRLFQKAKDFGAKRAHLVERRDVKVNLLGVYHGNDKQIRNALINRFGGESAIATAKRCSRKVHGAYGKHPDCGCAGTGKIGRDGPLAGVSKHVWSALAVACTRQDELRIQERRRVLEELRNGGERI